MGLKRFLWRRTAIGNTIDTIKNIRDEGSIIDGVKQTVKEDFCEDMPITSQVYQSGQYDGKITGYEEASSEYEKKLLKQADEFLNQENIYRSQLKGYNQLLDEYDKEIKRLNEKATRSERENAYLQELLSKERKLKAYSN